MKKLLFISLTVLLFSCKQELPSNIQSKLNSNNMWIEKLNEVDSIILNLNTEEIKNLSNDSAETLINKHNFYKEMYEQSHNELIELLKFNPEYSDYKEIKEIKYHFVIEKELPLQKGFDLIWMNINKLENKKWTIGLDNKFK